MPEDNDAATRPKTSVQGLSTGPGAGDNNAGGGNATGAADPDTALRTDAVNKGDKAEDRKKLFPEEPQSGSE
jgi:hypothetical protein